MGVPRTTQAASRDAARRGSAGRSAAERRCGATGAAMRRSANRPLRGVADAYRPPPGSWHDGAKHGVRCATMSTNGMTVNGIELEVLRHGADRNADDPLAGSRNHQVGRQHDRARNHKPQPVQARQRQYRRVALPVAKLRQSRLHIAAQCYDDQVRSRMQQLRLPTD